MADFPDLSKLLTLPCTECKAACCRYVGIEIDKPKTKADHDMIRWYLMHKDIHVYVDYDNEWHVEFQSTCENLQPDYSCGVYQTRPQICREHGWPHGSCEFFDDPHKLLFKTAPEYEAYLDKKKINWKWKRRPKVDKEG